MRFVPTPVEGRGRIAFPKGGGKTGAAIRKMDWSKTPLGAVSEWPPCLRGAISLCLNCAVPMLIIWGPERTALHNDAFLEIFGGPRPGALGCNAAQAWPKMWRSIESSVAQVARGSTPAAKTKLLYLTPTRGELGLVFSFSPIFDENGQVSGVFGVIVEAEAAAGLTPRAADARLDVFLQRSSVIGFLKDSEGRYVYISPTLEKRFGVRRADWAGKTDFELWPEPVAQAFRTADSAVLASGGALEVVEPVPQADGAVSWWLSSRFAFDDESGKRFVGGLSIDITARKEFESALRASEERRKVGAMVAGLALAEIDYAADCIHLSAEASRLYGLGAAPLILPRKAVHAVFHPDDREELMRRIRVSENPEGPGWLEMEHRILLPSGEERWLRARKQVFFAAGRPSYAILAAFDATAEKNAVERLRRNEEFLADVLDSLPHRIAVLDEKGKLISVNESWRRFARSESAAWQSAPVGGNYLAICRAAAARGDIFAAKALEELEALLAGEKDGFEMEYHCCGASERPRWYVSHAARPARGFKGVILSQTDITPQKEAEEALRESERCARRRAEELKTIFDMAPIGLSIALDPQGLHIEGNRANEEIFGLPPGSEFSLAAPNPPAYKVFQDGRELRIAELPMQRAARGAIASGQVLEVLREDGRWLSVLAQAAPLYDEMGAPRGAIGAYLDITDLKQAERRLQQSEERLRFALTGANAAAWRWNIATGEQFWTPESFKLHGRDPKLGHPEFAEWLSCVHPDDRAHIERAFGDAVEKRTGELQSEYRVLFPNGEVRWLSALGKVEFSAEGAPLRMSGINLDITERKRAEDALREADRRKDEFLATLAHELRNPLAAISNAVGALLRENGENLNAKERTKTLLPMLARQVNHLVRLVDDLLEISRISRGIIELRKERVDLASVLRHALETSDPLIKAERHRLVVDIPSAPIALDADPVRLAQVFANILSNAAKYTEKGGRIRLVAARCGEEARISVRDTGVGIAAHMLPRVFELFTQVDNSLSQTRGGLGIGLALARRLVLLHGGEIEAFSDGEGEGSEFVVRLPLVGAKAEETPMEPNVAATSSTPPRVLVIDDDRDVADSLIMLLEIYGITARAAYSGLAGLEMLSEYKPDVVFLDLGMAGMDGYETARLLRQRPEGKTVTLVALTGWGQKEDRRRTQEAGFDLHLTKPADIDAIMDLLASRSEPATSS